MRSPTDPAWARARRVALCYALAAAGVGASCGRGGSRYVEPLPRPAVEWPAVLGDAQRSADAGRFADADHALAAFADQYPDSPESGEALYWRAVLQLDPANKDGSTQAAAQSLDAYLALVGGQQHRLEAGLLRRVAGLVASLSADVQAAKTTPPATPPDPAALKARDDEIARLRDSLTKTTAELERVRKRLAPKS